MIGALVSTLVGPITGLLDKFIPDADTKAKLAHEIATMSVKQAHEAALAQLEVNKVEAGHVLFLSRVGDHPWGGAVV
jgi:hypothetical protein